MDKSFNIVYSYHHILLLFMTKSCLISCVKLSYSKETELQLAEVAEIKEKVFFLEGNFDQPCLVRLPNFNGVCG